MSHRVDEDGSRVVVIEKRSSGIGPMLLGAAIGATLALLLAPRSGAETRREIRRRTRRAAGAAERVASEVADAVADEFREVRDRVGDEVDGVREAIHERTDRVRRAAQAGRAAIDHARHDIERELAQTKAAYAAGARVARETSKARHSPPPVSDQGAADTE